MCGLKREDFQTYNAKFPMQMSSELSVSETGWKVGGNKMTSVCMEAPVKHLKNSIYSVFNASYISKPKYPIGL